MNDAMFERAVAEVLLREGGYVNNPADPGGPTNWGITIPTLRTLGDRDGDGHLDGDLDRDGDIDAADIRALPQRVAVQIYRLQFWERYRYGDLPDGIGLKVFDTAVWTGPGRSHRLLQQSLRSLGILVSEDGVLGPKTRRAVASVRADVLLQVYRGLLAAFLRQLVLKRPSHTVFLRGWLRRAYK